LQSKGNDSNAALWWTFHYPLLIVFSLNSVRKSKFSPESTFVVISEYKNTCQARHLLREEDGLLRHGDHISLLHANTGGLLSCDPYESATNDPAEKATSVSKAILQSTPIARNTFVIVPVNKEDNLKDEDQLLRWGIPFQLSCCPLLYGRPEDSFKEKATYGREKKLLLASTIKTEHRMSPLSCEQVVYLTERESSYDTHWVAQMPAKTKNSGFDRFVNKGTPIPVGERIVLQHCATQKMLASDANNVISTDFGSEYEVCANSCFGFGRVGALRDEFNGSKTANTNCRPEMDQHIWSFVVAENVEDIDGDKQNENWPQNQL